MLMYTNYSTTYRPNYSAQFSHFVYKDTKEWHRIRIIQNSNFMSLYHFYSGRKIYKMYKMCSISHNQTNKQWDDQSNKISHPKISLVFVWQTLGAKEVCLNRLRIPTIYSPVQSPLGMAKPPPSTGRSAVHSSSRRTHLSDPSDQFSH